MMYVTLGEGWSGVLSSQVADACRHLRAVGARSVRLLCFASLRGFPAERARVRAAFPGAIVLPMAPRLTNWRVNRHLLWLAVRRTGERRLVGRGALACHLALQLRDAGWVDAVGLDGRGAQAAEWREYGLAPSPRMAEEIATLEAEAVNRSDARLAVSQALVRYWRDELGYGGDRHVVVPCTVGSAFEAPLPDDRTRSAVRARLGYAAEDVVLAFAGAAAAWQSFDLLDAFLRDAMTRDPRVKALVLANADGSRLPVARKYPDRVHFGWVPHAEMVATLAACDHGLLLREPSVTNRVAAPTKLAEYLAAGLGVVVSEGIGDYSDLVTREGCGVVVGASRPGAAPPRLEPLTREERERNHGLALRLFTKSAHAPAYRALLRDMGEPLGPPVSGALPRRVSSPAPPAG